MKFDFNDILLVPEVLSTISSRSEVNVFDERNFLPLFTAPMDTVVNEDNADEFKKNGIYSIIPRGMKIYDSSVSRFEWYSYGLDEFIKLFLNNDHKLTVIGDPDAKFYVLIDIANGHMKKLYDTAKKAKEIYGEHLVLMIGNIANPSTYDKFAEINVDYIRCGIGSGAACTTSANVSIGYPMGSLISEISNSKKEYSYKTKIVADGGMKNYSDIIKALALGADYVMCGSIFNKAIESAGDAFCISGPDGYGRGGGEFYPFNLNEHYKKGARTKKELIEDGIYKTYRGMSTKEVQKEWGKKKLRTAEGVSKLHKVEYTLESWCENFKDYLSSAMSYCSARTLEEFKEARFELITPHAFNRFNK